MVTVLSVRTHVFLEDIYPLFPYPVSAVAAGRMELPASPRSPFYVLYHKSTIDICPRGPCVRRAREEGRVNDRDRARDYQPDGSVTTWARLQAIGDSLSEDKISQFCVPAAILRHR